MNARLTYFFIIIAVAGSLCSCVATNNFTTKYYQENEKMLHSIKDRFQAAYAKKPFTLEFNDIEFRNIAFEVLSDTLRHIYHFDLNETNLVDTLERYGYNAAVIANLITDMQAIRCTWISQVSYFENREPKSMVFISIRHNKLKSLLNSEKYYALAFFNERQFFDRKGRLTDKSEKRRMREINGTYFYKLTDRVCYAVTGNFR
jgi:hypothetical protein